MCYVNVFIIQFTAADRRGMCYFKAGLGVCKIVKHIYNSEEHVLIVFYKKK